MDEIAFLSASELLAGLRDGAYTSRDLLELYLARIGRLDDKLNAVVTVDPAGARAAADAVDEARAAGRPLGPLAGLPVTVKDSFETAGMRTTAGAEELADHVPARDAVAVARLRAAGAVIFGKTNLPAWAGDCQTYNELFGTTTNPWGPALTPGGSSGGSAAAVAAGLTGLELGSDLGGSIRIPAHFCGVYGLKPTWGTVSTRGHLPPPPGVLVPLDVAVAGPLARSADDLDLAYSVLAGPEPADAVAWALAPPPPRAASVGSYRLAAVLDDPCCPVDGEVRRCLEAAVAALAEAGAPVDTAARPPALSEGVDVAQRVIQGSVSHAVPPDEYERLCAEAAARSPGDVSPPARWARNITQRARDLNLALEQRAQQAAAWAEFFQHHDALLCPVSPSPAFPHDHSADVDARTILVDGEPRAYGDQFAWVQATGVVRLPSVVAPVGRTRAGLPVGVQIVGPHLEDRTAIDVARRLAEVAGGGGYERPPGF